MLTGSINKKKDLMDIELINSLESAVRARGNPVIVTSINSGVLYSTLTTLIYLLSRKRQNNALHMDMIMYLSEELNHLIYHEFIKEKDVNFMRLLFGKAELLLEACFNIMELAESKTRKFNEIEHIHFFKDEKNLIRDYLDTVRK
ncbi:hypothetical protein MOD62_16185 [Bacillus spizizenii]|nr:hypothetical protein [Bacillus spizizenii]MCY8635276.1 hypothetical protein [Bacillus spizizenii]